MNRLATVRLRLNRLVRLNRLTTVLLRLKGLNLFLFMIFEMKYLYSVRYIRIHVNAHFETKMFEYHRRRRVVNLYAINCAGLRVRIRDEKKNG